MTKTLGLNITFKYVAFGLEVSADEYVVDEQEETSLESGSTKIK